MPVTSIMNGRTTYDHCLESINIEAADKEPFSMSYLSMETLCRTFIVFLSPLALHRFDEMDDL